MSLQWRIDVTQGDLKLERWPARVSVPAEAGADLGGGFIVTDGAGQVASAQARTLVRWPDGSPRWVQLDFQAVMAGPHVVTTVDAAAAEDKSPAMPVKVERDGQACDVSVGRLTFRLDACATSPVTSIVWDGRELGAGDVLDMEVGANDGRVCRIDPAGSASFVVEAEGEHRFQASWETRYVDEDGQRLLDVRFRVEALAGVEGLTVSHQFFHRLPSTEWMEIQRMHAGVSLTGMNRPTSNVVAEQTAHTHLWVRRFVRMNDTIEMHLDRTRFPFYVDDVSELEDEFNYPWFLFGANQTGPVVALEDDDVAVLFTMRDVLMHRPKTLGVSPGRFDLSIWPEYAQTMHLPQGRSNRQVLCLRFEAPSAERVDTLLSMPKSVELRPAVCWLDAEDSAAAGASWDQARMLHPKDDGAAIFSNLLSSGAKRWETVAEMFHHGDCPDPGYGMSYPAAGRVPDETGRLQLTMNDRGNTHPLLHDPKEFPPVWTNNEYDAIYCLALEAMRSKDASVLYKMEAAARHQIEVDFVHYSDHWMQHRSTPAHSYDHNTSTSTIPSHQWTQGLYYYYAITGDDDVLEVIRAICDFDCEYMAREETGGDLSFDRELGWTVMALVCGYEATAEQRYLDTAEQAIRQLQAFADRTEFGDYEKKRASSRGLNRMGIGVGFNVNTIPLGVKLFHQATGEEWAKLLLMDWVDFGMGQFNDKATGVKISELFPETFCYVCELVGDYTYVRESLWQVVMFYRGFNTLNWLPADQPLSTKQFCRIYRGLSHLFHAAARADLLETLEGRILGES